MACTDTAPKSSETDRQGTGSNHAEPGERYNPADDVDLYEYYLADEWQGVG
jgi:hypothetical protein